jgi:chromosome segregation ATPase
MIDIDIAPRVQKLEGEHLLLSRELTQMNKTLSKIETAIEKQNEIASDIRLLRQEFTSHVITEHDSFKRQNERIEHIEKNLSKIVWMLITAVIGSAMTFILKVSV